MMVRVRERTKQMNLVRMIPVQKIATQLIDGLQTYTPLADLSIADKVGRGLAPRIADLPTADPHLQGVGSQTCDLRSEIRQRDPY